MYNIYLLNETFTNGYRVEVLDIISLLAILCGILVITSKNPIVSVLFLIGLFLSIASYLMILGLNFIGLSFLFISLRRSCIHFISFYSYVN
jgi:NADH-ubiquinone oxidoreductase chain 6